VPQLWQRNRECAKFCGERATPARLRDLHETHSCSSRSAPRSARGKLRKSSPDEVLRVRPGRLTINWGGP